MAEKYTSEQLDAMLAAGHAFPNAKGKPSYPIGDEEDLRKAIKAVGRGNADHDAIRKYIIGRAKDLGLSDLIPGDWNADGSIAEDKALTPPPGFHTRGDRTFDDIRRLVQSAIASTLPKDADGETWVYVYDLSDSWAVYSWQGELLKVTYTLADDGAVTLGEPVKVTQTTSYAPLPEKKSAPRAAIQLKRAFTSLVEQRPPHTVELSVRMASDEKHVANFRGYASTTGEFYSVRDWLGEYNERINAGAFMKTLREQSVPLLFNHDGMPIAMYRSDGTGTCELSEDRVGLLTVAGLDRRQSLTNDLCFALQRGDVNKMSFSFRAVKDDWNDGYDERSVSELALYDTSIVTYPANPNTTAELRSAMRSALGREGQGLMYSARSAIVEATREHRVAEAAEPVLDSAMRALAAADEFMCARFGQAGRSRTFVVASLLVQAREGKVLSGANEKLLRDALTALHAADDALTGVDHALDEGQAAISTVLDVANPDGDAADPDDGGRPGAASKASGSGLDGDSGGTGAGKNPVQPIDGAGPRSEHPTVIATRALVEELRRPGGRR